MTTDPVMRFKEIFHRAKATEGESYNAAALATVGKHHRPVVRTVLVKHVDGGTFVFYANLLSRKARELASNNRAALCSWWPRLETQVRVEGTVSGVDGAEAD